MSKYYENLRKPKRTGRKISVGKTSDLPEGRGATVQLKDGSELAIYHVKGKFYAMENFCPHKGAPLADSPIRGTEIECELHGWRFDLETGVCRTKKDCDLEVYEVVIEDDFLKIIV